MIENVLYRLGSRHLLFMALVVLGSFLYSGAIEQIPVRAASTQEQTDGYQTLFTNSTRLPQQGGTHLWMSNNTPPGAAGNYVPRLAFYVYKHKDDNNVRVHINGVTFGCGSDNKFDTMKIVKVSSDKANAPTIGGGADLNCSKSGSTMTLTLTDGPGSRFSNSDIYGDDYRYALVYLRINGGEGIDSITVDGDFNTGDRPKLSLVGDRTGSSITRASNNHEYSPFAPSITLDGTTRREISLNFAPPCDATSAALSNKRARWKDADSNTAANGLGDPSDPGTKVVTYRVRDNTGSYQVGSGSGGPDAGSDQYDFRSSSDFNMIRGRQYNLTFYDVSAIHNNTIQILLPFNQTPCIKPPQSSWTIETDAYIQRNGSGDYGTSIGDLSDPEAPNSPTPGQSFRYVTSAENSDSSILPITGPYTTGGDSYQNPTGTFFLHFTTNTAGNIQFNKKLSDNGDANTYETNGYRGYTTAVGGTLAEPWGYSWGEFTVDASHGGRERCVLTNISPTVGNRDSGSPYSVSGEDYSTNEKWTYSGSAASTLCVNVPYYYNLIPTLTLTPASTGSGTQQGDAIGATGVLTDTSLGNGRQHTNSQEGKVKGVVEFVLPPNTAEPTITGEARVSQEPCTWVGSKGIAVSASNCARRGEVGHSTDRNNADSGVVNANGFLNINGGRTGAETQNLAVGTKLCYSTYVNHPRHINSDDYNSSLGAGLWSYSTVQCRVIIKAPKVQFENSDVTVGRYRSDGQAHTSGGVTSSCEPPVTAATINTSGAPNAVTTRSNPHYYGSWSEYGAFATGGISGFGSAARPFGIGMDNNNGAKRLMFSNTNSGNFRYGGQCLQNPFNRVTLTNSTNLITQTPQAFDSSGRLRLNELAEKYDASFDRTGYVSRGQNVDIAQPGSDIPMTTVVIRAKSKHATGNSGCPKLRVVASRGTTTDQDTKGICSTSFQSYTYQFYMNTDGPQSINAQMVNDAWSPAAPSTANRDLAIESIEVNGQEVYKYGESHPGVTGQRTGSGSCESAAEDGMFFVADAQSATGGTANYCYGMNIAGINTPVQEDPDHGPYNPLPAKSTITVSANAISSNSYAYGASTAGGCPQLYITVIARSGGTSREDLQHVCRDTGGWQDYTFTTNIGAKGIESVEVGFDPPDAYGGNPSKDLFVRSINVNGTDYPTNRSAAIDLRSNNSYKTTTDSSIPDCTNPTDRISMFAAQDSATSSHCVGIRISNVVNSPPPPPPASVLDGNYDRFKGRNIVIYSQKNSPSDSCSATSDGNLRISQNIAFRKDGYTHITELPRIVLIADCNITIADNVTEVNATLIAGDAIKTCSQQSRVISQCNQRLRVNGAISANRLLLWRTYGADLVDETAAQIPAESFNLGPSQMVAGYSRGTDSAKPKTVHEIDLPPRY